MLDFLKTLFGSKHIDICFARFACTRYGEFEVIIRPGETKAASLVEQFVCDCGETLVPAGSLLAGSVEVRRIQR